jgi:surface polysaccharide O-acyltransferase-like enzyme
LWSERDFCVCTHKIAQATKKFPNSLAHSVNLFILKKLKNKLPDKRGKFLGSKIGGTPLPVDLIRTAAIFLVIMLHAAIEPDPIIAQMTQASAWHWWTENIYNTLARPSVPLFVLLSGSLLLQPSKIEPLSTFFKKRFKRIGLPFLFWGIAYFAWRFFVNHEELSLNSILQGIFTGPYFHFWFLYMLVGLYLITPILRVIVAYSDRKLLGFFILLWFLGVAVAPLLSLFGYSLESNVFVILGWVGYYLLGIYLLQVRLSSTKLFILLILGLTWTAVGTYFMTAIFGGIRSFFFNDYLSASVILTSVALFQLLRTFSPIRLGTRSPRTGRLLHQISQNTLPIYLFHVMILESLQKGYFGFKISVTTLNPAIEIPLITILTLVICLAVISLLNRIPFLKKAIGSASERNNTF